MKTLLWNHLPCDDEQTTALGAALNLHPTVARLLCMRGLGDAGRGAARFLHPTLDAPPRSASARRTWAKAVERIEQALGGKERIAIHGDYDVDGITSTVILRRALEMLGGDVVHFIPERLRDGYGLQPAAIDRLHAEGVQLDHLGRLRHPRRPRRRSRARELGVDLIITDHHEPDGTLPPALRRDQPEAARLHAIPTRTSRASASR